MVSEKAGVAFGWPLGRELTLLPFSPLGVRLQPVVLLAEKLEVRQVMVVSAFPVVDIAARSGASGARGEGLSTPSAVALFHCCHALSPVLRQSRSTV